MRPPLLALGVFLLASVAPLPAADWREGYVVLEDTKSPDGHYGILVPTADEGVPEEADDYLVDLKTRKELGVLKNVHYFEHANRYSLGANWSEDSTWAVIVYDWRFGFTTLLLVEIENGKLTQTDLSKRIQNGVPNGDCISVYTRTSEDGKIRVRAVSTNDPKAMHEKVAKFGLFQGTYDRRAKKWTVQDGRPLKPEQYDALSAAYLGSADSAPAPDADASEQDLDRQLNSAYAALRAVLPPAKFAAIKAEQVAWLKKRDATQDEKQRCKLLQERVEVLQELLW